ncbi:alpha/beta fold hydrolase [Actinospica robiniae]|uniref:alpha/beta fold hydrolase n=1 Tax=Actinospica robiniae TaxID=304901 RepID=UPI0004079580|nr:alpha/beta hydrolase [Actinospica robiniae]
MTGWREYTESRVAVPGGELAVLHWAATVPDAPVLLLAHGITANALVWSSVVAELAGRAEVIAPDLRGRAGSRGITGPWGITREAQDLVAVLDAFGIDRVPVLGGHSLGAFVGATAALGHPERFGRFVAVDGGLGFPLPSGADPDAVLEAVVGPAVKKLSMTFADAAAYLDFHRAHPSFVGNWSEPLTAYLVRDTLVLPDGRAVSSCVEDAIRADGRQVIVEPGLRTAINELTCPVEFVYAARGMLNEEQALYDESRLVLGGLDRDKVRVELVPGTNHYTVVGPGAGARAIVRALLR